MNDRRKLRPDAKPLFADAPGGISHPSNRMPRQLVSDEAVAALYKGQRYDNYRGKEMLDNTPVYKPHHGMSTSSTAMAGEG